MVYFEELDEETEVDWVPFRRLDVCPQVWFEPADALLSILMPPSKVIFDN